MENRKRKYQYPMRACLGVFCIFFLGACQKNEEAFRWSGKEADSGFVQEQDLTDTFSSESTVAQDADIADGTVSKKQCYVHICGAINKPGVYCVEEGSRLYEVILLAGGMTPEAADATVNQAQEVSDGMQIYIPTDEEAQNGPANGTQEGVPGTDGRVNINTAGMEQLCTLPGIGETRAQAIIAYRTKHGAFQSVEELMNVSGIKAGIFERIKELIRV